MSDETEELRGRVEELERRVSVLFQQTGSADWEAEAANAPPVPDEVRLLLEQGEERKAAKLYMQQTGASLGDALAALGELAKEIRAQRGEAEMSARRLTALATAAAVTAALAGPGAAVGEAEARRHGPRRAAAAEAPLDPRAHEAGVQARST